MKHGKLGALGLAVAVAVAGEPRAGIAAPVAHPGTLSWCDVRAFGAKGDGVEDDSAAVRRAADAVADFGTLHFPPGAYLVRGVVLPSRRNLTVSGRGARLIGAPNGRHDFILASHKYANDVPEADLPSLCVSGLVIDGRGRVGEGLVVQSWSATVDRCEVSNCRVGIVFTAQTASGKAFGKSTMVNGRISGNRISGCVAAGIQIRDPARNKCTDNFIQDNLVFRCGTGIRLDGAPGTLISGNHLYGNDRDIDIGLAGVGSRLIGNFLESRDSMRIGDVLAGATVLAVGNDFRGKVRATASRAGARIACSANTGPEGPMGEPFRDGNFELRPAWWRRVLPRGGNGAP